MLSIPCVGIQQSLAELIQRRSWVSTVLVYRAFIGSTIRLLSGPRTCHTNTLISLNYAGGMVHEIDSLPEAGKMTAIQEDLRRSITLIMSESWTSLLVEMKCKTLPTKLHIGAFNCPVDGWLNTDITPHIFITRVPFAPLLLFKAGRKTAERFDEHRQGIFKKLRYLKVAKKFPFRCDHFSSVFSSHVLEHIFPSDVPDLMTSIYRVLRPGGSGKICSS
jgi:hypothetical protein